MKLRSMRSACALAALVFALAAHDRPALGGPMAGYQVNFSLSAFIGPLPTGTLAILDGERFQAGQTIFFNDSLNQSALVRKLGQVESFTDRFISQGQFINTTSAPVAIAFNVTDSWSIEASAHGYLPPGHNQFAHAMATLQFDVKAGGMLLAGTPGGGPVSVVGQLGSTGTLSASGQVFDTVMVPAHRSVSIGISHFGSGIASTLRVTPEPSALALAVTGALALLGYARRGRDRGRRR